MNALISCEGRLHPVPETPRDDTSLDRAGIVALTTGKRGNFNTQSDLLDKSDCLMSKIDPTARVADGALIGRVPRSGPIASSARMS